MAYKDSDQIANDSNYALGDYSFRIERSSGTSPSYDKFEAICTKEGKNARKSVQLPSSTKMIGWYVEANDTTADVYIVIGIPDGSSEKTSDLDTGIQGGIPSAASCHREYQAYPTAQIPTPCTDDFSYTDNAVCCVFGFKVLGNWHMGDIVASSENSSTIMYHYTRTDYYGDEVEGGYGPTRIGLNVSFTHNGKTVWYGGGPGSWNQLTPDQAETCSVYPYVEVDDNWNKIPEAAWTMVYGTPVDPEYEEKTMLVGRFAIEIKDAGGVGPGGGIGGGWDDPEDYDEDWEEGDPTHTLYVEVTGALSGRHNDPIVDPSYSYIPADKDTVKDYGCGGDGGHGGGGGAGASTVIVHKFATNQANSKEVTAIAKRHGYGSGGGKGGKGGDGCILVYY